MIDVITTNDGVIGTIDNVIKYYLNEIREVSKYEEFVNNHYNYLENVPIILDLLDRLFVESDWDKVIEVKYNPMGAFCYKDYTEC